MQQEVTQLKRTLQSYIKDDDAVRVVMSWFNLFQSMDGMAQQDTSASLAKLQLFMYDMFLQLPTNPHWQRHGAAYMHLMADAFMGQVRAMKFAGELQSFTEGTPDSKLVSKFVANKYDYYRIADLAFRLTADPADYLQKAADLYSELVDIGS